MQAFITAGSKVYVYRVCANKINVGGADVQSIHGIHFILHLVCVIWDIAVYLVVQWIPSRRTHLRLGHLLLIRTLFRVPELCTELPQK